MVKGIHSVGDVTCHLLTNYSILFPPRMHHFHCPHSTGETNRSRRSTVLSFYFSWINVLHEQWFHNFTINREEVWWCNALTETQETAHIEQNWLTHVYSRSYTTKHIQCSLCSRRKKDIKQSLWVKQCIWLQFPTYAVLKIFFSLLNQVLWII